MIIGLILFAVFVLACISRAFRWWIWSYIGPVLSAAFRWGMIIVFVIVFIVVLAAVHHG